MSWIFIEPTDVLFFRDARPYSAGETHTASSLFPPLPTTIAGAFRSLVLGQSSVDWQDFANGKPTNQSMNNLINKIGSPQYLPEQFNLRGPFLARRGLDDKIHLHSPMPADAFLIDEKKNHFGVLRPRKNSPFASNWPEDEWHPLWPPGGVRQEEIEGEWWLPTQGLENYLQDKSFNAIRSDDLLQMEPRIGIARDHQSRQVQSQMIYTTAFVRLDDRMRVGLLVWVDDSLSISETGWFRIGGEGRSARYEIISADPFANYQKLDQPTRRVKVLLLTPAFFQAGWKPEDNNWDSLLGLPNVKLTSVALKKPLFVGGWDMVKKWHKDMHAYVPAGSVYYFELQDPINELNLTFTQTPSGSLPHNQLGFGEVALGTWDWQVMD